MKPEKEKIALARKLANEAKLHPVARGLVHEEITRYETGGVSPRGNTWRDIYSLDEIIENLQRMPKQ
jgi:hypothetical protein